MTETSTVPRTSALFTKRDRVLFAAVALFTVLAGVAHYAGWNSVVAFLIAGLALAALASLVGRSVEALGDRLGAAKTGVLQSALGNLPELFVCIFALKAGLTTVVQATIVGSILANVLLVLGAAFIVGGLKHGSQKFPARDARNIGMLLFIAVAALAMPTLTAALHTPADGHERELSVVVAVLMLVLFALSLPASLGSKGEPGGDAASGPVRGADAEQAVIEAEGHPAWPLGLAVGMLAVAGVGAAFVSDWFVIALTPAMESVGISDAFAGLVIVAIAGNAVENVVGIQLAARNQADYSLQVVLQSPLQVALIVTPVLILVAPLVGATFTLVLSPLLLAVLLLAAVITALVVYDGESNWLEGVGLVSLYAIIAAAFWWG